MRDQVATALKNLHTQPWQFFDSNTSCLYFLYPDGEPEDPKRKYMDRMLISIEQSVFPPEDPSMNIATEFLIVLQNRHAFQHTQHEIDEVLARPEFQIKVAELQQMVLQHLKSPRIRDRVQQQWSQGASHKR